MVVSQTEIVEAFIYDRGGDDFLAQTDVYRLACKAAMEPYWDEQRRQTRQQGTSFGLLGLKRPDPTEQREKLARVKAECETERDAITTPIRPELPVRMKPTPSRGIDYSVATIEASIRLTLDYLAATTPAYDGGVLVRDEKGAPKQIIWEDVHVVTRTRDYRDDVGFNSSGYQMHEENSVCYGFDSSGHLIERYTSRSNHGARRSHGVARINQTKRLDRELRSDIMEKLYQFRANLVKSPAYA